MAVKYKKHSSDFNDGQNEETHLKRLEDVFGAVLVCLFCRKLCFLKLQKLTPKNLQINEKG